LTPTGNTGNPYGPFSPTAGTEAHIDSFPFGQANSFNDPNSAWHVVVYENVNRNGNLTHYDSSQGDISSRHAYSANVYLNVCG
jgi:hypothetical protein